MDEVERNLLDSLAHVEQQREKRRRANAEWANKQKRELEAFLPKPPAPAPAPAPKQDTIPLGKKSGNGSLATTTATNSSMNGLNSGGVNLKSLSRSKVSAQNITGGVLGGAGAHPAEGQKGTFSLPSNASALKPPANATRLAPGVSAAFPVANAGVSNPYSTSAGMGMGMNNNKAAGTEMAVTPSVVQPPIVPPLKMGTLLQQKEESQMEKHARKMLEMLPLVKTVEDADAELRWFEARRVLLRGKFEVEKDGKWSQPKGPTKKDAINLREMMRGVAANQEQIDASHKSMGSNGYLKRDPSDDMQDQKYDVSNRQEYLLQYLASEYVKYEGGEDPLEGRWKDLESKIRPRAHLLSLLCCDFPILSRYIRGAFYTACPYCRPGSKEGSNFSAFPLLSLDGVDKLKKDRFKKEVLKYEDGEDYDTYCIRMTGRVAMWAAQLTMAESMPHLIPKWQTCRSVFSLDAAWTWLASFCNTPKSLLQKAQWSNLVNETDNSNLQDAMKAGRNYGLAPPLKVLLSFVRVAGVSLKYHLPFPCPADLSLGNMGHFRPRHYSAQVDKLFVACLQCVRRLGKEGQGDPLRDVMKLTALVKQLVVDPNNAPSRFGRAELEKLLTAKVRS
jgi:hypothetical protein